MKNLLALTILAISFAGCAPTAQPSSVDTSFAPASPLGAKVSGKARLSNAGDGTTTYQLTLQGLPASATLGIGVYAGSCTNQGVVKYALPDLKSDSTGNATLEVAVKTGALPIKAYINVHQRSAATGFGAALACANIR
jgi:hypothetical protein